MGDASIMDVLAMRLEVFHRGLEFAAGFGAQAILGLEEGLQRIDDLFFFAMA